MGLNSAVVTLVENYYFLYSNNLKELFAFYDVERQETAIAAYGKEFISTFINENSFFFIKRGRYNNSISHHSHLGGLSYMTTGKKKTTKLDVIENKPGVVDDTTIRIVNIVVSTSLEHDIPLEKMAAVLPNTEYNPEQFPGLVIRIKEPKTSALIFSSGKVVCTGARTLEKVEESIAKIIESLKKINIDIKIKPKITVQNVVASGTIGMDLNLNKLAMKLDNTEYEPEQFPGLVYKLMEAKATFLLFSNGKIVCTGTKSKEQVFEAINKLVVILQKVK